MPDERAFEAFYGRHRRFILAYCTRRALPQDAEDAADETFLVAWRRWDDVPADAERPWLYGVARRVLANQHRGDRRRQGLTRRLIDERAPVATDPESGLVDREDARRILAAFGRLAEDEREILRLVAWEGLRHDEIAVVLGCSANTSRQRLHRARRRLERQLGRGQERAAAGSGRGTS